MGRGVRYFDRLQQFMVSSASLEPLLPLASEVSECRVPISLLWRHSIRANDCIGKSIGRNNAV